MNKFYGDTTFGFEVIGTCTFLDEGFQVTVRNIRLNPEALNQCILAEVTESDGDSSARVAWEQKVYDLMGATRDHDHSAAVTHVLAEICTVVTMERATTSSRRR